MSDKAKYNRIQKALRRAGVFSRAQLLQFDKRSNFTDIKFIGRVLGPVLRHAVDTFTPAMWQAAFPMLFWGHPTQPSAPLEPTPEVATPITGRVIEGGKGNLIDPD